MLDRLKSFFATLGAMIAAPFDVPHCESETAVEPKPYVDPEKAALMVQVKELTAKLDEVVKQQKAERDNREAQYQKKQDEVIELTAQRDTTLLANASLAKDLAAHKAEVGKLDAKIADLEHVIEAVRTEVK